MNKITARLITAIIIILGGISACATHNNSNWMKNYQQQIESKTINKVLLAGSHYANAYGINNNKQLVICSGETKKNTISTNAYLAQIIATTAKPQSNDFLNYLNTQNSNIIDQLNGGIRYLELQICLQDNIYYTSNYYLTDPLNEIIKQIKDFLAQNPQELIIIDLDNNLHSNSGLFNPQQTREFYAYLMFSLGPYLVPQQELQTLTFAKLWQNKPRIILFATHPELIKYPNIWNKSQFALTPKQAHYTTIKKLTALQKMVQVESNNKQYYSIIPIYSWLNAESNNLTQLKRNSNDHLILEYLYTLPSTNLNIIVTDHQYITPLANFTIQRNSQ
jgi:hypothetical protein